MKHTEDRFKASDGSNIYYQLWEPATDTVAVVMICHGVAEHGGRYRRVAQHLNDKGYAVAALDLPGHGKSSGKRGHVSRFANFVQALELLREQLGRRFPRQKFFLLGHSMGGLVSATYLLDNQQYLDGCILSGPAFQSDAEPALIQLLIIRILSSLLPTLPVLQLDGSAVSRDPQEVKAYFEDELVYTGRLSARLVSELFNGISTLTQQWQQIKLPLLIMHGDKDTLTSPKGSEAFYASVASEDKRLQLYPGLYHEILNEPEREQIMTDISDWLSPRV